MIFVQPSKTTLLSPHVETILASNATFVNRPIRVGGAKLSLRQTKRDYGPHSIMSVLPEALNLVFFHFNRFQNADRRGLKAFFLSLDTSITSSWIKHQMV